jgi:hypothetical protein
METKRGTLRKAKRSSGPDLELTRSELQALPARLLTKLPIETRILVQASVTKGEFILSTGPDAPVQKPRDERRRPCWLSASEVDALVLGVEAERVFASDLTAIALRKLHDRSFRVTEEHALGGAQHPEAGPSDGEDLHRRRAMTIGQVLAELDLEITGIELGPVAPAVGEPQTVPARAA